MRPLHTASLALFVALASWATAGPASAASDCKVLTGAKVMLPDGPSDDSVIVLVDAELAAAGRAINGLELNLSAPGSASF